MAPRPPPAATAALLALICVLAVAVRLFPVAKWGSVIHEFDPHFNYRVTRLLRAHGALALRDWFDDRAWFPLGRSVGETVYPGLMLAALALQWISETLLRLPMDTRVACVLVTPLFAAFACVAIYALTLQVTKKHAPALTAAALLSMCPAYISRSTGGSFDNEGVAIFLLVATFWLWVRSVQSGAMLDAALTAICYFAMVVSWGGYVFIINLIPLHVLALLASGRYSSRVYIAYSTFYPLATLLAMQVPFVGFNAITKAETAGSHVVFLALQAFAAAQWLQASLSTAQFTKLLHIALAVGGGLVGLALVTAMALGKLQWTGRSLTLLDPTYASKYIPIIASVGEHQPTPWATLVLSLGPIIVLAPLGLFYCFDALDDARLFMVIYTVFSFYFSGIMVRLLLTLAPAACFMSALGVSELMTTLAAITKQQAIVEASRSGEGNHLSQGSESSATPASESQATTTTTATSSLKHKKTSAAASATTTAAPESAAAAALQRQHAAQRAKEEQLAFWTDLWGSFAARFRFVAPSTPCVSAKSLPDFLWLLLVALMVLLLAHMSHCMKVTRIAYSSTAMTYNARDSATGAVHVHDDYREAYAWLRQNAEPDAKILGWWDYGYQISALANRTVIVDNNTWNNTHIATVGRVLTSPEEEAWPILQSLEVDYIFVLFGGRVGMSGDDLDKLPWILRIAQDVFAEEVIENEFTVNGRYLFDHENATSAMQQSLLYKMSYYRFFNETSLEDPREVMIDNVRNGNPSINASAIAFDHIEEAFTSDAWIVRIFRVKRRA